MTVGKRGPQRENLSPVVLGRMGIPTNLFSFELSDLDDQGIAERKKVINYVKKYVDNLDYAFDRNVSLFFYGANGVGKSTIASLIIKEAYRRRYRGKRCTFSTYFDEYAKTWNVEKATHWGEDDPVGLFYHNYKAIDFLVIEEIGKATENKIHLSALEDLLRYREEKGLPTIICTNLSPKVVEQKYGASIFSLLRGNFQAIEVVGRDLRVDRDYDLLNFNS